MDVSYGKSEMNSIRKPHKIPYWFTLHTDGLNMDDGVVNTNVKITGMGLT